MRYRQLPSGLVKVTLRDPKVPKKQHFFSAFHLAQFANASNQIHVFTKIGQTFLASVDDCAQGRYFHEYEVGKDRTDGRIEATFAALETMAGPVLDELLSDVQLSHASAIKWSLYMAGLFFRSSKFRTQLAGPLARQVFGGMISTERLREMQYECWQQGHAVTTEQLQAALERQRRVILSQPAYFHFFGMNESIPKLAFLLVRKNWVVLRTPVDAPFITTDAPVVTAQIQQNGSVLAPGFGFAREMTAVFVPLSPSRLLIASPPEISWKRDLDRSEVHKFNILLAQFGEKYLYACDSRESNKSIAVDYLNKVVFGVDAYCMPSES